MKDNPKFPDLWPFVVYNPDSKCYLTSRIKLHNDGGYCTYWSVDRRKAKFYRTRRHALKMVNTLRQEGHAHVSVMELRDV